MNNQDRKANLAYGALITLLALALLTFITRLWPILLLMILGVFAVALRLLFLSAKPAPVQEQQAVQPPRAAEPEPDLDSMIFASVCKRVDELVRQQYPRANWVWELPDAKQRILNGESAWILLNQAGGYRRGEVRLNLFRVDDIDFPEPKSVQSEEPEPEQPEAQEEQPAPEAPAPENFELLAFEWVEAHILELNTRCNEAIGNKRTTVLLKPEELPQPESWPAICAELAKQEITNTACTSEGIWIKLEGGAAA